MSNVSCLSYDKQFTKFIPQFNTQLKSIEATVLIGQLEYWFSKYREGFYKFMEPCDHSHYREGDSWTEELSLSRKVFNRAFDLIGVRYKSKSAFDKAEDKFQGKLYASYYDRNTNKTYYIRNHEFLSNFLNRVSSFSRPSKSSTKKSSQPLKPLRNGPNGRSPIYKETKTTTDNTPPKSPSEVKEALVLENENQRERGSLNILNKEEKIITEASHPILSNEDYEISQKVYEIWVKYTNEHIKTPPLTQKFARKLLEAFETLCSSSYETWEGYCKRIASSKFLMGKAESQSSFKVWLIKAIQPQFFEKIRAGEYGVDPSIELSFTYQEQKRDRAKTLEVIQDLDFSCLDVWERHLRKSLIVEQGIDTYIAWFSQLRFTLESSEFVQLEEERGRDISEGTSYKSAPMQKEGVLKIFCPSAFKANWIGQKFGGLFDKIVESLSLKAYEVSIDQKKL